MRKKRFLDRMRQKWLRFELSCAVNLWQERDPARLLLTTARVAKAYPLSPLSPLKSNIERIFCFTAMTTLTEVLAHVGNRLYDNDSLRRDVDFGFWKPYTLVEFTYDPQKGFVESPFHLNLHLDFVIAMCEFILAPPRVDFEYDKLNKNLLRENVANFQLYLNSLLNVCQ